MSRIRIIHSCENFHEWNLLCDEDNIIDQDICPICKEESTMRIVLRFPDCIMIKIEPAVYMDENGEIMHDDSFYIGIEDAGSGEYVRTDNAADWSEVIAHIDEIRKYSFSKALKRLRNKRIYFNREILESGSCKPDSTTESRDARSNANAGAQKKTDDPCKIRKLVEEDESTAHRGDDSGLLPEVKVNRARIIYTCENNHQWSILSDQNDIVDQCICPLCNQQAVFRKMFKIPSRIIIKVESAAYVDKFRGIPMGENDFYIGIEDARTGEYVRTDYLAAWPKVKAHINDIRRLNFSDAIKRLKAEKRCFS